MSTPPAPTDPGSGSSLGLLFRQVRDAVRTRLQRELAEVGHELSLSQYITIKTLAQGDASVTELARAADLHPGAMTRLLDKLAERGLVERIADPADRRALVIRLTGDGEALWNDVRQCGLRVHERGLHGMDDETRAQLMRLVEQVRDNLLSPD